MASAAPQAAEAFDVVIVGAGFSGMYMLHRLRGMGMSAVILEMGDGVGGTWYWNRYPGARVDIESRDYGYSFDPELEREWRWTERFAAQPELLRYLNHVADRYDLRRDIRFETKVTAAHFDEATNRWDVATEGGAHFSGRFCVMATGCLSEPKDISFPGAGDFQGESLRTFGWPDDADLTGKRVGIIGTGSTAIQTITTIAPKVAQLTVFQRTPNYSVPARNHPVSLEDQAEWDNVRRFWRARAKSQPAAFWNEPNMALAAATPDEGIEAEFERRWELGGFKVGAPFADTGIDINANRKIADLVAKKIAGIVKNPAVADKLTPKTYPFATKRLCVDTGYYEVYNRDNVELIDIRETPIERITATGIRTSEREFELDTIIYATGFDAMTGTLTRLDIRGRGGRTISDKWKDGPVSYLGLMIAGFPNFFTITGPGSPSVLTNMVMSIEQHVDFIADTIEHMNLRQQATIEATEPAEAGWVAHVAEVADMTLYPQADSWYMGANVPGKPRVFLPYVGGFQAYVDVCNDVVVNNYKGFALAPAVAA